MTETTEEEGPRHVGPYRLDSYLGRGGLGEIWRAWDERLERWVAVKRLRGESDAVSRARFLREARAAARLAHPAVIEVFDVLEQDGVGWIVMEWLDGPDLATLLDDGPLDVDIALDYARQVAEGLAAAHAAGIVHRDLKSQNVMALPSDPRASAGRASAGRASAGRVKILDFGLAKARPLDGSDGETAALSLPGRVVGTPRSMSPEQALGRDVDFRTDLFALGVLLYELLTGRFPFRGATATETLSRVMTHEPVPLEELNPRVPPPLAELVRQLLEKDPAFRPEGAAEVAERLAEIVSGERVDVTRHDESFRHAATLDSSSSIAEEPVAVPSGLESVTAKKSGPVWVFTTVVAITVILVVTRAAFLRPSLGPPSPDTVASQRLVVALEVELGAGTTATEEVGELAYTLRHALVRTLGLFEALTTVSTKEVDAVSGPPTAIARSLGADEVLESTLHCQGPDCSFGAQRVDGSTGRILGDYLFDVPSDPLLEAARAVEIGVRQEIYPREKLRTGIHGVETTPEDFMTYIAIQRAFDKRPGILEATVLREQLARLQERSPRFVEAVALEAQIAIFCYQERQDPELLERALERVAKAQSLAPGDPKVLLELAYVEIEGNRLEDAERTLKTLEELAPGEVGIMDMRASLHSKRGEAAAALVFAKMALERRESWERLYRHAKLAKDLGEVDLARESLTRLLEQNPEHAFGLSLQANLEVVHGDARKAVELYERLILLASTPTRQTGLGVAHLLLGDYAAAAAAFEQAVEAAPNHPAFLLNLADSRWLEGRFEESSGLYHRILSLKPPVPDARELTRHAQALAHLGRNREAVAATREALEMAPEAPDIAYEAALVFAVTGPLPQALAQAVRAIDLGYGRHWFDLPWFDELRAHPDFVAASARDP